VAAELKRLTGRSRADFLVVTHFHEDHTGDPAGRGKPASGVFGLIEDDGVTVGTLLDHGDDYPAYGEKSWVDRSFARSAEQWRKAGRVGERRVPAAREKLDLGGGATVRFVAVNGNTA